VSIRFLSRHHPASFHVDNACSDRSVHLFRVEGTSQSAEDAGVYNNKRLVRAVSLALDAVRFYEASFSSSSIIASQLRDAKSSIDAKPGCC